MNVFIWVLHVDLSSIRLVIFIAVLKVGKQILLAGRKQQENTIRDAPCSPQRAVWYLPDLFIDQFMIYQFNSAAIDNSSANTLR